MPATQTDRLYGENSSVALKAPVRTVSVGANLVLSGLQTVGGVALSEGDRILVKDQADPTTNGIYNASASGWQRSGDFDGAYDVVQGTVVIAYLGNGQGLLFQLTTANPVAIGSSALTFRDFTDPNYIVPQSQAEANALVVPTNYAYAVLNPYRYGADGTGGAADIAAYNAINAVIAQLSGLPWWKNGLTALPNDVRRYGAVGDNVADDSAAFTRALTEWAGKAVWVPSPPVAYKWMSGVVMPDNTAMIGDNKRSCKIIAGADIDLLTLGDGSQVYKVYLEGNATKGHGILVPSGKGNQTLQNFRAINFDSSNATLNNGVLHFADNTAGSRISVFEWEMWQTNGASGSGKNAIYVPDVFNNSAVPRKFGLGETAGKCFASLGGCNDLFVTGSFLADIAFSSNSRGVQIEANRIANQVAIAIDGANHTIVGNDILPQVILNPTLTATAVGPNSLDFPYVTAPISNITQAAAAVVTVTTVSGTNPFKVGQYVNFDNVVGMTQINEMNGPVTAIGGASGAWTVTVGINSSGFGAYVSAGNLSARPIVDNSGGNNSVQVYHGRLLYTPTVSISGGGFVLGNGSIAGYYTFDGGAILFWIQFVVGSTTNFGAHGTLRFALPVPKQDGEVLSGIGGGRINQGATNEVCITEIPGNVNYCHLISASSKAQVSDTSPIALATGNTIWLHGAYQR